MIDKNTGLEAAQDAQRPSAAPCYILGVDLGKEGSDRTAFRCPTCEAFQELVSPDYLCKKCGKQAVENAALGI